MGSQRDKQGKEFGLVFLLAGVAIEGIRALNVGVGGGVSHFCSVPKEMVCPAPKTG